MWKPLDFSFGIGEAEMFAAPAPNGAATDGPGRPYRSFGSGVRDGSIGRKAGPIVDRVLDRILTDRVERPRFARRRRVPERLLERARHWKNKVQLARIARRARKTTEAFRFVVVGDAEPGRFQLWRSLFNEKDVFPRHLRRIRRRKSDFILQLGDMVSRGLAEQYEDFLTMLDEAGLKQPYLSVLGNYDRHSPHGRSDASVYRQLFGAPNYAFDHGAARLVVLDTSGSGLTPARLRWLDTVLSTRRRTLVFTHKPPRQFVRWTSVGIGGFHQGSEAFVRLMARHRVDRVYMGHIHGLGVLVHRGVRYVLSGGGGSPLFPSGAPHKFHHHLVVEVSPEGVRETVSRLDGIEFPLQEMSDYR